jgi:phospholipid/cholesterol/gamma-HCH transport system permease protein
VSQGHPGSARIAALGRYAIEVVRDVHGIMRLLRQTGRVLDRLERGETFRQAHALANQSIFFVVVIMGFCGAILVVQACTQAQRIIGDLTVIGPGFLQLVVREFGPTIVAFMIAARYGAGAAAELGAMQITEQIDALRMAGADPESYLVAPRIAGGVIGMLPMVILGTAVAFVGGYAGAHYGFGIGWESYFRLSMVVHGDVLIAISKSLAFGVAVPLVSCYAGLAARGGAPGVGRATTWAVIWSCLAVLLLDLLIGGVGYLVLR